jgi:hypothetical protein
MQGKVATVLSGPTPASKASRRPLSILQLLALCPSGLRALDRSRFCPRVAFELFARPVLGRLVSFAWVGPVPAHFPVRPGLEVVEQACVGS